MFSISARTVLELGAELISSDIIAFYELIKNCFDAGSPTGAEVRFSIVLRRNQYLALLSASQIAEGEDASTAAVNAFLIKVLESVENAAAHQQIEAFVAAMGQPQSFAELRERLTVAYRSLNTITVADTGSGMSLGDLKDNYLVIGTPSRKRVVDAALIAASKDSTSIDAQKKAPYLGEKGIGRLSAMRLGERLLVETAKTDDAVLNTLDIDWRKFHDLDALVSDISITPETGDQKPAPDWSGTTLTIADLSEDWTSAAVERMANYDFARIVDPFSDPKDRPRVAIYWNQDRIRIPWLDRELLKHANAQFSGEYEINEGKPVLTFRMEAISLGFDHPKETDEMRLTLPDLVGLVAGKERDVPVSSLVSLGPFSIEGYWYNRKLLTKIESIGDLKTVRELQRKWSGLLLYRDGFRVFPYGDDDDDWLGLDRKALGRPGYMLNKNQFVGRVKISRLGNPQLVDQTNREGLRETPEQIVLINILQTLVMEHLWDFIREIKAKYKNEPVDLIEVKADIRSLEARASSALRQIRDRIPQADSGVLEDLQHVIREFKELADRAQQHAMQIEQDSKNMLQMAGVGLMVEVVAHELARSSENALRALEGLRNKALPEDVKARLETLRAEMKSVSKRLRVLDPLSVSGRQRSETFDLVEMINDLGEAHSAQFHRHNVTFDFQSPSQELRVRTVKGMMVQILENLIANALYWTQVKAKRESSFSPRLTIRIGTDPLTIMFSDNGPGIAPDNVEKVFRPFWSLKEKAKRRGLGLYIARECANFMGGKLYLSDANQSADGRLREFILELPGADIR